MKQLRLNRKQKQAIYAVLAFSLYLRGLGEPIILAYTTHTILNIVRPYATANSTVPYATFNTVSTSLVNEMLISLAFTIAATILLMKYLSTRKEVKT
jgi:hypothetical protein